MKFVICCQQKYVSLIQRGVLIVKNYFGLSIVGKYATKDYLMQQFESDRWSARIYRSPGKTLKKATCSFLEITNGTINESPGRISRFEALAYSENPKIPAPFIMTDIT